MEEEINKILDHCYDRREIGAEKYGVDGWKLRDMFEDMREELYDTINYAIFQILKINRLEEKQGSLDCFIEAIDDIDEESTYFNCKRGKRGCK